MSEDESEAERNMRIARSVLDEETALDMARTFIKLTKVNTTKKKTRKTKKKNTIRDGGSTALQLLTLLTWFTLLALLT